MAVAAARRALRTPLAAPPQHLLFASTTAPFADRLNATLIAEALSLPSHLRTTDTSGSLRAGLGALRDALESSQCSIVVAADKRRARPASAHELTMGDGSAAFVVSEDAPIAWLLGSRSVSLDFIDHYRASGSPTDYYLEERWRRDEGHLKILPELLQELLAQHQTAGAQVDHLILSGIPGRTAQLIAQRCGIRAEALSSDFQAECGDTGNAHPLMLLAHALQLSKPGDRILVAAFGQGGEALLLVASEHIDKARTFAGLRAALAAGVDDHNYLRYLSFSGFVELDWGIRAERDTRTAQPAFYRHRKTTTAFIGGRCTACGTTQFPKSRVCANPGCRQPDCQLDAPLKDTVARVRSFTEDWLAVCSNPPLMYGNVSLSGGAVAMLEFTDFAPGELRIGTALSLQFRIKDHDPRRGGFTRYCWKAAPVDTRTPADA